MGNQPWDLEAVKTLHRLWRAGYSAGVIGKKLGRSKNSVVGKAHRMGLESRESPIKSTGLPKRRKAKPNDKFSSSGASGLLRHVTRYAKLPTINGEASRSIGGRCQWIAGEPSSADDCKCKAKPAKGSAYCEKHLARAYTKSRPWTPTPTSPDGPGRRRNI